MDNFHIFDANLVLLFKQTEDKKEAGNGPFKIICWNSDLISKAMATSTVLGYLWRTKTWDIDMMGRGGGLVVSVLAFYSDNPTFNPAEAYILVCTIVSESNENKKVAGFAHLKNMLTAFCR